MQSLEQITEKTFFQKIKNSFLSKLIPLFSAGAFAFASCGDGKEECKGSFDTFCTEGITYSVDSCGNLEDIKEHCGCGCNPGHTGCKGNCCGDGKVDIPEGCDSNDLKGNTCQSLGYDAGTLRCTDDCRLDISDCCNTVSCSGLGKECGTWDNGCSSRINCGSCDIDEICDDGNCIPSLDTKFINGIPIKSGKTNHDGQIFFTDGQTGEEVIVTVKDRTTKTLLSDVNVRFFDGNGFEGFDLRKADYISHFDVLPHNSSHEFSLSPESHYGFTVFDYYFEQDPEKLNAMENYLEWSENSYTYDKCMTKEEIERDREASMFVLSLFAGGTLIYKVVSTAADVIVSLEGLGVINPPPIYQVFNPLNFTAPPIIEGSEYVPENCTDNIDNDCDGRIDSQDDDCTCTNECSSSGQRDCFGNAWKECGDYDSDRCLEWGVLNACNSDEHCENGECIITCSDECSPLGQKECYDSSDRRIRRCNPGSDGCLEWDYFHTCDYGSVCENGECVTCLEGQTLCDIVGGWGYWICGDYDGDGVREWGSFTYCDEHEVCTEGHCFGGTSCRDNDGDGYGDNCNLGEDCDDSNRNIYPGAPEILNGLDDDCDGQIDEGFVNTGNPQVTLYWNNTSDLDLHVYSPDGCHIYYNNRNCGTGHLDRDANMICQSGAGLPPENIYWDTGQAPSGTYRVEVDYYKDCSSGPTPYTVSVSKNGDVTTYSGTLINEGSRDIVTSFVK